MTLQCLFAAFLWLLAGFGALVGVLACLFVWASWKHAGERQDAEGDL